MKYTGTLPMHSPTTIQHFGIKGQKWGVRRYQNEDGSLTAEGYLRYRKMSEADRGKELRSSLKEMNEALIGATFNDDPKIRNIGEAYVGKNINKLRSMKFATDDDGVGFSRKGLIKYVDKEAKDAGWPEEHRKKMSNTLNEVFDKELRSAAMKYGWMRATENIYAADNAKGRGSTSKSARKRNDAYTNDGFSAATEDMQRRILDYSKQAGGNRSAMDKQELSRINKDEAFGRKAAELYFYDSGTTTDASIRKRRAAAIKIVGYGGAIAGGLSTGVTGGAGMAASVLSFATGANSQKLVDNMHGKTKKYKKMHDARVKEYKKRQAAREAVWKEFGNGGYYEEWLNS